MSLKNALMRFVKTEVIGNRVHEHNHFKDTVQMASMILHGSGF